MKPNNTTLLLLIIIVESILIVIVVLVFVRLFCKLKQKPTLKNEVDEEVEKELNEL